MPFARLTLTPAPEPETAQQLAADLTALIAHDLNKRFELTSVLIETPTPCCWTIGAASPPTCAHLTVNVTATTNTADEKRTFVSNAMALLRKALPGCAPATYVVVQELPGSDWGYDGKTQADRAMQRA